MKRLFFLNLLTIIVLLPACQKLDVEPGGGGDPVFSAGFTVNGQEKSWQAGVDSFYMYAGFEQGTDDVFVFTGELKMQNCSTGCESLKIYVRDFQVLMQGNPNVAEALRLGNYEWAKLPKQDTILQVFKDTLYNLNLDASSSDFPDGVGGQYFWQLPDSLIANGLTVVFDSSKFEFPLPVTLQIAANNANCYGWQTRQIAPGTSLNPVANCSVKIEMVDTTSTFFSAVASGAGQLAYLWSTGETASQVPVPTLSPVGNTVGVTVTDANGCTSSALVQYAGSPGAVTQICSAAFDYELESFVKDSTHLTIVTADSLQLGQVILEHTDAFGNRYRSDAAAQDSTAFFEIQSVEDFGENESGQPTKKLKIAFACRLKGINQQIIVAEGTAVFAVAYPD